MKVFSSAVSHTIKFDNPVMGGSSEGAVYVARKNKKKGLVFILKKSQK
jgi:hypothetical protein